ncbi:transferase family-domain-containing protein [Phyllosticta citrichinensis]|uniref:Transferase family-domain-containing protein n=1 Tax=Phyllosticta citrichinensis TaxID=1130410 RepID=A0ABR1Y709_9PEZI
MLLIFYQCNYSYWSNFFQTLCRQVETSLSRINRAPICTMEPIDEQILELSILDQVAPDFYIRQLFCFKFPDSKDTSSALHQLHRALQATVARWPILAGVVTPIQQPGPKSNLREVRYSKPTPCHSYGTHLFGMKWLSIDYEKLHARGMPQSELTTENLSSLPNNPKRGERYPVYGFQVNFVDGGLILCFTFSHMVLDGVSKNAVYEEFGRNMRLETIKFSGDLPVKPRAFVPLCSQTPSIDAHACVEYDYGEPPPPLNRPATGRLFIFKAHRIAELKEAVVEHLRTTDSTMWASTCDCLCALLWTSIMKVRFSRLSPYTIVKFSQSADSRSKLTPSLPADYFGNAFLQPFATARLEELVSKSAPENFDENSNDVSTVAVIASAALRIRNAIQSVDKAFAQQRLDLWASLQDPSSTLHAFWRALDMGDTGIFLSSWVSFGADVDFSIPGTTTGCAQWIRKTRSASEGACNILPRKLGTKGDADWEVLVQLSVEDMERLCEETEFGSLAMRVIE